MGRGLSQQAQPSCSGIADFAAITRMTSVVGTSSVVVSSMTPSFDRLEITQGRRVPPILLGRHTPAIEVKVRQFYLSVAEIFERWVSRRSTDYRRFGALTPTPRFDPARSLAWNRAFSYLAQGGLDQ
jgi:hypothetical protein